MDRVTRRPMFAAAVLSAALHAAALALVFAQRAPAPNGMQHIAVEIAWESGNGSGAASGATLPSDTQPTAQSAEAASVTVSESADSPPSMSPSDQVRGRQSEGSEANEVSSSLKDANIAAGAPPTPSQDAPGEIKVGADLRSAPARSRPSDRQLASARPSSPASLTLSADLILRQAQDEVGSRRARKRAKELELHRSEPVHASPGRTASEPSPACRATSVDVGQGEGSAVCAGSSESSAAPAAAATGMPAGAALAAAGDVVSRVPPAYPMTARRRGLQGTAMVRAHFDAQGRPQKVAVVTSSGSAALDDAARDAVTRWRFRAGAAGVLDMPITFRLDGRARGGVADAAGG